MSQQAEELKAIMARHEARIATAAGDRDKINEADEAMKQEVAALHNDGAELSAPPGVEAGLYLYRTEEKKFGAQATHDTMTDDDVFDLLVKGLAGFMQQQTIAAVFQQIAATQKAQQDMAQNIKRAKKKLHKGR